jgi:hypothetical protein
MPLVIICVCAFLSAFVLLAASHAVLCRFSVTMPIPDKKEQRQPVELFVVSGRIKAVT